MKYFFKTKIDLPASPTRQRLQQITKMLPDPEKGMPEDLFSAKMLSDSKKGMREGLFSVFKTKIFYKKL